jgi:hypothetical protein
MTEIAGTSLDTSEEDNVGIATRTEEETGEVSGVYFILNFVLLKEQNVMMWTAFMCLMSESSGRLCDLKVPQNMGTFLTGCVIMGLSRRILLLRVGQFLII